MSKGYTLQYFINTFKNTRKVDGGDGVYLTVSPRFGYFSVKAEALDTWLQGETGDIVSGRGRFASYGKTARARVLRALNNRKNSGLV